MSRIAAVRPVLLSAPYADPDSLEVRTRLPSGWRTTGLVEITLTDGTVGLGEGYLAVFAPRVFTEIVDLLVPYLIGKEADDLAARYRDLGLVTGYWSLQGAARHVVAACEIALVDAVAKQRGVPAWELLGVGRADPIRLYASGGDSTTATAMQSEIDAVSSLGIGLFKIRARAHQPAKAVWTLEHATAAGIEVAVDMTQNLADPGLSVPDVVGFLSEVRRLSPRPLRFLEEPLGAARTEELPQLRAKAGCPIAGGETVTTAQELTGRIRSGCYDLVQPDATVVGGTQQTLAVLAAAREHDVEPVVHCWGSAVCLAANYHTAFAGGGRLAEWPMPTYPLREELLVDPFRIQHGHLLPPRAPGLGVHLSRDTEQRYPFRPDAVYHCLTDPPPDPPNAWI